MQRLKRAHGDVATDQRFDSLDGRSGALNGGDARDSASHRGGADLVAVHPGTRIAVGSVDDHVDLSRVDQVHDVVDAFEVLAHHGARDAVATQRIGRAAGSEYLEAEV